MLLTHGEIDKGCRDVAFEHPIEPQWLILSGKDVADLPRLFYLWEYETWWRLGLVKS